MKTRKSIARLLSILMALSLLLGISAAPVYAVGGEGETATFEIRESNGQTGTVQYKLDSGEFTVADSTPVDLEGVSSITIKAIPVADAQVNQSYSGITGTEQAVSFDYTALTSASGWTYNIQDNDGNITFKIEFDNNDGTFNPGGGGETASFAFEIQEANGQTGTVQYKLDNGEFTVAGSTPVDLEGVSSITIKAIPVADAQVNQSFSGITGTEQAVTFDYGALISESGWTYNIQDNDGNILFRIVFDNHDGTGGGSESGGGEENNGNAVHANVTVNISGEELEYDAPWSNDAADFVFGINDSEMRRLSKGEVNYTTEGDKIVGLATKEALGYEYNYDDSGNVTFNIKTQWDDVITSLTINGVLYDTPQTKDDLINAFDADFRGIRFDIENVPYAEEYHIVVEGRKQTQVEKIMGNFGWTYDPNSNEYSDDDKIPYGNLEFVEAKYNGVTYDSIEKVNEAGGTFQWDDGVKGTDDPTGEAMFPTGTELTLRLIPDAGYQLTSLELNGTPFEPGEEVGLYTFTIGGGNWHLGAQFTQVGAEVQASSVNIKSGNIDINENFEYGTAKLEVSDVASMSPSRMEEFENTATDEGYEIENYLDISLYNAVYKGGTKDVNGNYESWDTPVENIENKAAITLELENDMSGKDLAVIHELHNGEEIIGYELINATYNEENNTITFESDSFSHYAIVSKEIGGNENLYYIDLGTGSWTVGDVTVSAPDGMSGVVPILDTETIPTEMLANFDPETMDITLTVSDGFVIYLEIDENGNTTLVSTRDGVELPPYGETLIFSVVKKPETESYTLTDDKGNVISLTYEKDRELSFTMIDYLAFSPEELETMGIPQELYDSMMEGIVNATKQHGTLLSFYEIQVENDDGFLIHEGPFNIKIKMTDEMKKYDIFKIIYVDTEDNFATEAPITLTRDGEYLVGTLEHLSTYALVGSNTPSSPQTGDNSMMWLWVALLFVSGFGVVATIVIGKKKSSAK